MNIPKHIGVYHIQASIFTLLNKILPHLNKTPFYKKSKKSQINNLFQMKNQRKEFENKVMDVLQDCFWDSEWSQT